MNSTYSSSSVNRHRRATSFSATCWLLAASFSLYCGYRAYSVLQERPIGNIIELHNAAFVPSSAAEGRHHTKSIEDVQVGDEVLAYDSSAEAFAWKPVERALRRETDHCRVLTIKSPEGDIQEIRTTDEHPFWVPEDGWRRAGDLQKGTLLQSSSGHRAKVQGTRREDCPQGHIVFNITVGDLHTYFVAQEFNGNAVLVHNAGACDDAFDAVKRAAEDAGQAAIAFRAKIGSEMWANVHKMWKNSQSRHFAEDIFEIYRKQGVPESVIDAIKNGIKPVHEKNKIIDSIQKSADDAAHALNDLAQGTQTSKRSLEEALEQEAQIRAAQDLVRQRRMLEGDAP